MEEIGNTEGFKRKLTAVFSADVVVYSRLMGKDESATNGSFTKGMSFVIIDLMGAREYHAEILNLDPDRDVYFKWAKDALMFMILPILNSCEMKE